MDSTIHLLNNWDLVCMWGIHFIIESKREVPSCLSSSGFCKGSFSSSVFSRRAFSLRVEGLVGEEEIHPGGGGGNSNYSRYIAKDNQSFPQSLVEN